MVSYIKVSFLILLASSVAAQNIGFLRTSPSNNIASDDALDIIQSEQCVPMIQEMNDLMGEMMVEFSKDEIIEYACTSIQRKKSIDRMAKMPRIVLFRIILV